MQAIPLHKWVISIINPMSVRYAIDPFAVRGYSKRSPLRMAWRAHSQYLSYRARQDHQPLLASIPVSRDLRLIDDRGSPIEDTAVTSGQLDLLKNGLESVRHLKGDIVEVGSYHGVTTAELAPLTSKLVYAVDPFSGYGASEFRFRL